MQRLKISSTTRSLFFRAKATILDASAVKETIRKLGKNHEELLLSQTVSQIPTVQQAEQFKQEFGMDIINKEDMSIAQSVDKSNDFQVENASYLKSYQKYAHGKVNIFDHKQTHFTLVGCPYHTLPIKNSYKLLSASKPDAILLQIRPDQILQNFNVLANNPETNCFSSTLFGNQLCRTGFEVMPRSSLRLQIKREIVANNILLASIKERDPAYYQNVYKKTILESKNNKEYKHLELLSDEAIGVACFYAERNNIPIILCDQPELVFRQNIANTHTLMQLQNLFTRAARQVALFPDLQPQTPLAMAYQMFPELMLSGSDKYISTLIEYLIATKKYSRITGFLSHAQSQSAHEYLMHRDVSHLADELMVVPPEGSILRDITCEEIIEKHALLDVMYYGKDILERIEDKEFKTTLQLIDRYADPEKVDRSRITKMKYLHFQLIKKYAKFAKKEFEEGKEILRKEFLLRMGH